MRKLRLSGVYKPTHFGKTKSERLLELEGIIWLQPFYFMNEATEGTSTPYFLG